MDNINWFPGHMAKARKELKEQLRRVDLVIELCDARLPYSSRNPDLDTMISGKRRVLLINKTDLAEPSVTEKWLHVFREKGITCFNINADRIKRDDALRIIIGAMEDLTAAALERGVRRTVRAMAVGVPNVGKSTLINRIYGHSTLDTADKPGVTRSNRWVRISPYIEMLDTPGLLWPRLDRQDAAKRLCYIGSIKDEIIDQEELAECLLHELAKISPASLAGRFHIDNDISESETMLEKVCKGRGFLISGGRPDTVRGAAVVLDEYRSGKLGRITLEDPDILKAGDINE